MLFICQMTFYSAVALYLPSLPLYAALGIPQTLSIGLVGCICIVYCTFGGIKAVTWTNLYHTILLMVAMGAVIIAGLPKSGGLLRVLETSYEGGRMSLGDSFLSWDLTTRHTIFNTLLGYTLVRVFLHGTSQMQVQSALSLSSMRRSQMSQLLSALFYFLLQAIASAIGLLLYVHYKDCDPYANGEIKRQDELMVHYVSQVLDNIPAMQGIFIAAIFGSTLTAMSSFQSSTSAMVVEDFVRPIYRWLGLPLSDELAANLGKLMAFLLGLTCIGLTFEMERISGLQQATTTLYGVIGIPIFSAFVLGVGTRFVNTCGMFAGMLAAILFGVYVFVCHIFGRPPLEPSLAISTAGCRPDRFLNATTGAHLLGQVAAAAGQPAVVLIEAAETESVAFSLAQMSYLWLPFLNMIIATVVASIVSILTGGSRQEVDEKYLAPIFGAPPRLDEKKDRLRAALEGKEGSFGSLRPSAEKDSVCRCGLEPFAGATMVLIQQKPVASCKSLAA